MGESDRLKRLINGLIWKDSLLGRPRARHFISDCRSSVLVERRTGPVTGHLLPLHAAEERKMIFIHLKFILYCSRKVV